MKLPSLIVPPQELEPEKVPLTVVVLSGAALATTVPDPLRLTVQRGCPVTPPAGTVTVNDIELPFVDPVIVPV